MGLVDLGLRSAAEALRGGRTTAVDLCETYLRRIEETDEAVNAYVTVDPDGAVAAAAQADAEMASGIDRGPLHGIPVGIKDLFDTAGLRTTYGSGRYRKHVPQRDAEAVSRLRELGAVILGKHATHEFAWGGRTDNPHFGPTRNPHDPTRIPGGSSGGGAASVVARSCLLALGTDTAGSVRIPAALSGCVGLKPTSGWLGLRGVHPLAPSLDHVGMLGRSVEDVALAYDALNGTRPVREPVAPQGLVVGILRGDSEALDPSVHSAVDRVRTGLDRIGVVVHAVDLPDVDERAAAVLTLIRAEAEPIHRASFADAPASYGPDLASVLAMGEVSATELSWAHGVVERSLSALTAAFTQVDVLVGATVPFEAPLIGSLTHEYGGTEVPIELLLTRFTSIANAAGIPALSLPVHIEGALPAGVQLMARKHAEPDLIALAQAIGQAVDGQRLLRR